MQHLSAQILNILGKMGKKDHYHVSIFYIIRNYKKQS